MNVWVLWVFEANMILRINGLLVSWLAYLNKPCPTE